MVIFANKKIIRDESVIALLGIGNLPLKKQDKVVQKLEENIQRKIVLAALKNLNSDDREALSRKIESNSDGGVYEFLNSTIPNLKSFVEDICVQSVEEFKELSITK